MQKLQKDDTKIAKWTRNVLLLFLAPACDYYRYSLSEILSVTTTRKRVGNMESIGHTVRIGSQKEDHGL
jgi:hypothetical protein